jgi:putative acyl-CoA dehydrogenase
VNLFTADPLLTRAVRRAGGEAHLDHLSAFGAQVGTEEASELGQLANRNPPAFKPYDRYGRRIDEVEFHPAYHALMAIGLKGGVSARAWTHPEGGQVAHAALLFLMSQAESGVTCPMSMTYAAVPALRQAPAMAEQWVPRVLATDYDPRFIPPEQKRAVTLGMAMTEKQGGSDVRANTTRAYPMGGRAYTLVGHKWFCSAPMSDAFLTLAYAEGGLSCFLVPRWCDGERNGIQIQRLKDKLGDKANASSEIEYQNAIAFPIGEEGKGVRTIVQMVNHTRLDCIVGATSLMRQALSLAIRHVEGRSAFQKRLIDQPLMQAVLADVAVEVEACLALAFRTAQAFDRSGSDPAEAALARVLTPVAKYWTTKRCPVVVAECMEAHGGAGYIEEGLLPRLYRSAPLNGIWEGSGNVIALDILRALGRDPQAVEVLNATLAPVRALSARAAQMLQDLAQGLSSAADERRARALAERLALLLAAATLQDWGRGETGAAVLEARAGGATYGAGDLGLDTRTVLEGARLEV